MCSSNQVSDDNHENDESDIEAGSNVVQLLDDLEQVQNISQVTEWPGFKLVGDNIDKNFHPSFNRHSNNTYSMHAFHIYAVQDRIDFAPYSDINPNPSIDVTKILISKEDITQLKDNTIVLLSRYNC